MVLFLFLRDKKEGEGEGKEEGIECSVCCVQPFSLPRCCAPVLAFFAGQLPPTRRDGIASASGVRTKANVLAATLRPRMISKG